MTIQSTCTQFLAAVWIIVIKYKIVCLGIYYLVIYIFPSYAHFKTYFEIILSDSVYFCHHFTIGWPFHLTYSVKPNLFQHKHCGQMISHCWDDDWDIKVVYHYWCVMDQQCWAVMWVTVIKPHRRSSKTALLPSCRLLFTQTGIMSGRPGTTISPFYTAVLARKRLLPWEIVFY